ncbi:prolipoprotein diacylglyceryl transferase [Rhodomicrobium udaipurense]|uniref:Phosphatidylglycerol--prolipoprotein diacylglyceryl transferase n=1 Tax=Rhodomicrobium udaipurense TaxID=1202716 RepID=A0A8I1KLI0_9HYPH|nr:prolipoprotein diacylglyceryl transferase [Rhodomicrobium udaipurense]MBJ7543418.1 prolipoprotein diacylglyceryl transferase [Rhodomicrobium udaipurense]
MDLMAIAFPFNDPVAVHIGPLGVRWYGLAYMAGLLLGWLYMRRLCAEARLWGGASPVTPHQADDFLFWATLGTVLGGRLGFFLMYEPSMLLHDPLRFFRIWEGGMAFHGGLLGVGAAIWIFARLNRIPVRSLMDLSAAAVPFGLFFGRLANFINGEIYGRLSDVPWAVEFPARVLLAGDAAGPRHPVQLYEAALEGLVMFVLLRYFTHSRLALRAPGLVTGVFLAAYGVFRIFAEYFKEWDYGQFFTTAYFSEGVVYSLPMIALGVWFVATARRGRVGSFAASGRA